MNKVRIKQIEDLLRRLDKEAKPTEEDLKAVDNAIEEIRKALSDVWRQTTTKGAQHIRGKKEGELQSLARDLRSVHRKIDLKLHPDKFWDELEEELITFVSTSGIDERLLRLLEDKSTFNRFQEYLRNYSPVDALRVYAPGEGRPADPAETEDLRRRDYLILASINDHVNENVLQVNTGILMEKNAQEFWQHVVMAYGNHTERIERVLERVGDDEKAIQNQPRGDQMSDPSERSRKGQEIEPQGEGGEGGTILEGEWSKPMTKVDIMKRLGMGLRGYRKLATYSKDHPIEKVSGNRQLWQIRIDKMPGNLKEKFK